MMIKTRKCNAHGVGTFVYAEAPRGLGTLVLEVATDDECSSMRICVASYESLQACLVSESRVSSMVYVPPPRSSDRGGVVTKVLWGFVDAYTSALAIKCDGVWEVSDSRYKAQEFVGLYEIAKFDGKSWAFCWDWCTTRREPAISTASLEWSDRPALSTCAEQINSQQAVT